MPRKKKEQVAPNEIKVEEVTVENKTNSSIPPIARKRNEHGLLDSVDYKYRDDGSVDWRAMVSKEFLYPNKDKTNETDVSKLKDNELVIMLGGLKELARIRGFKSIEFSTNNPNSNFASTICKITWIPNYETEGREVTSSDGSCAHIDNVNDFMLHFLTECSINRSFARCIRSFLNINIVSHEELFDKTKKQELTSKTDTVKETNDPYDPLRKVMSKLNMSFEKLQAKCVNAKEHQFKDPQEWGCLEDIPKNDVFHLLKVLNKALESRQ